MDLDDADHFLAGARRLITYRRVPEAQVDHEALRNREKREEATGVTADDLNAFRRKVCTSMTSLTCFVTANAWRSTSKASKISSNSNSNESSRTQQHHHESTPFEKRRSCCGLETRLERLKQTASGVRSLSPAAVDVQRQVHEAESPVTAVVTDCWCMS